MTENRPVNRAPRSGLLLMAIIVAAMALVALHANVQRMRRDKLETVVVKALEAPRDSATASPSPAPR